MRMDRSGKFPGKKLPRKTDKELFLIKRRMRKFPVLRVGSLWEYNGLHYDPVNFLQIWVFPKQKNIKPRHDQKTFDQTGRKGEWQIVVSPKTEEGGVWINQDARMAMTKLEAGKEISFSPAFPGNGVFLFVLEGEVDVDGKKLERRDGLGISATSQFTIKAGPDSELLAIEVPMFA